MLSSTDTQAHAYPNLKISSLLSIGQLFDSDCSELFTKNYVTILNSYNTPVLNLIRNTPDVSWNLTINSSQPKTPLAAPTTSNYNYALHINKTKSELASYLHTAAGCPTKSTFVEAINNRNFITWPGLTSKIVSKNMPLSIQTLKVHLRQEQQNIRSTKTIPTKEKL